jgi:MOSC domain-containing protein YiiM
LIEGTMGTILAVCVSLNKGEKKKDVGKVVLRVGHGIEGDAHAGNWHRQVSLLADESVDTMRGKGVELKPGDFAENLTVKGIDLKQLVIGQRLQIGKTVVLEITQKGKECHNDCAIKKQVGDCVMPREGVFAKVIEGGEVIVGDSVAVIK